MRTKFAPKGVAGCENNMAASALGAELTRLFESLRSSSLQKGEIAATSAANLYTLCIDRITVDTGT